MKIGYMRVSTDDQDLSLQRNALQKYGCDKIFEDKISGSTVSRPGLDEALKMLAEGDSLIVWKMDRLGRTVRQLKDVMDDFAKRNISFVSLTEVVDTSTPPGRLFFHMLAAFAEFEKEVIGERVRAGMIAARNKGVRFGPEPKDHPRKSEICALLQKKHSIRAIQKTTGLGRNVIWRISQQEAA